MRYVRWPRGVRVDAALEVGQEVGTFYDPMLAKLIASGASREAARLKMVDALDDTAVLGLTTNLGFLRRLLASEPFAAGAIHTSWLDHHASELPAADTRNPLVAAALFLVESARRRGENDPFGPDGWRPAGPSAPTHLALGAGGERHDIVVAADKGVGTRTIQIDGAAPLVEVRGARLEHGELTAEVDGRRERFAVLAEAGAVLVSHRGASYRFEFGDAGGRRPESEDDAIVAPLPGLLVAVSVGPGDPVLPGDVLGVLESMKMEYSLTAAVAATVERVGFAAGSQVARGDVLFQLVPLRPGQSSPSPNAPVKTGEPKAHEANERGKL